MHTNSPGQPPGPELPEIIEGVRRAFLAVCAERRIAFEREQKKCFNDFCHESGYAQRWPDEALRLAEDEVKVRNRELKTRLADAIEAGWRPSPTFNVKQAFQRCFSHDNHDEDPSSDLYDLVVGAFARVGRPMSRDEEKHQRVGLGNAHVRGFDATVHDLDMQATKKYGSYRTVHYNEEFRLRVLKSINEYFLGENEPLFTAGVLQRLGLENNEANGKAVGRALVYWLDENAIKGNAIIATNRDSPVVGVSGMTSKGTKIAEGRPEAPSYVSTTYNIRDSKVGVAGNVSAETLTINVGSSFADMAKALELLRDEMKSSEDPMAGPVEATAEQAAALARAAEPDRNKLERMLMGLGQLIQTVAVTPQAWAFLAVEAAKAGFNIPGPPVLPP